MRLGIAAHFGWGSPNLHTLGTGKSTSTTRRKS